MRNRFMGMRKQGKAVGSIPTGAPHFIFRGEQRTRVRIPPQAVRLGREAVILLFPQFYFGACGVVGHTLPVRRRWMGHRNNGLASKGKMVYAS